MQHIQCPISLTPSVALHVLLYRDVHWSNKRIRQTVTYNYITDRFKLGYREFIFRQCVFHSIMANNYQTNQPFSIKQHNGDLSLSGGWNAPAFRPPQPFSHVLRSLQPCCDDMMNIQRSNVRQCYRRRMFRIYQTQSHSNNFINLMFLHHF